MVVGRAASLPRLVLPALLGFEHPLPQLLSAIFSHRFTCCEVHAGSRPPVIDAHL
jgi:hypothetical protein